MIPNEWKHASVVPVSKKGDKGCIEIYRPISLKSLIMKSFGKVYQERTICSLCRTPGS